MTYAAHAMPSKTYSSEGMGSSRKAQAPMEVHIKRTANGGFIVRHSYDNSSAGPSYRQDKDHAFTSHKEMMAHVHTHTGGNAEASKGKEPDADDTGADESPRAGVGKKATAKAPGPKTHGAGVD